MAGARSKGTVGIVGLGIMGGAFARNLIERGWRVVGFDISAARQQQRAPVHGGVPDSSGFVVSRRAGVQDTTAK